MNSELENYKSTLDRLLDHANEKTRDLSREALNWWPNIPETNSIAVIVVHMCGVVSYWMYQAIAGVEVNRDRDSEFRATVDDNGYVEASGRREKLPDMIARAKANASEALQGLDSETLDEPIQVAYGEPRTKRQIILHTIDELAQHVGHLDLTRQMWEVSR